MWVPLKGNCPSGSFSGASNRKLFAMEKASLAAPARSTESSDELSVAAAHAMGCSGRGHEADIARKPRAPARNVSGRCTSNVQGTASDVVEGEGIPATAEHDLFRYSGTNPIFDS